ncbi:MAG: threonine-phosphate decarboxylase CobD [Nitratireductor sp.]
MTPVKLINPVFHGGGLDAAIAQWGGDKANWLDLSTGINPNPYSNLRVDIGSFSRLPDSGTKAELLDAARAYYGLDDNAHLIAGNGTQALIEILPKALGAQKIGIISPTYGEHAHVWKKAGAEVLELDSDGELPRVLDTLDALVVVNPNNPTAQCFEPEQLREFAKHLSKNNGTLIVDEAFCDTRPELSLADALPENAIVLKSIGKFFGLAGIRLGFAACHGKHMPMIEQHIGPWMVNGVALEVGTRALKDTLWQTRTIETLNELSDNQSTVLKNSGLKISGANALFIYVEHAKANKIFEGLAKRNILVRQFKEREGFLRIGLCKDQTQLDRLDKALNEVMANV